MKLEIRNSGVNIVIFRMEIESGDSIYQGSEIDNCKFETGNKNDYSVDNSFTVINPDVVAMNADKTKELQAINTFTTYFDGVPIDASDPLFIAAAKSYLINESGFIFA